MEFRNCYKRYFMLGSDIAHLLMTEEKSQYDEQQSIPAQRIDEYKEEDKQLMVTNTHTVIYPGAMMIHLDNASVANGAMMCPCWLEGLTSFAVFFVWEL